MIKAVFFDFDGVLTTDKTGSVTTIRHLSRKTGLSEADLWEAFAPFNDDLLHGRTSHIQIWPHICAALGHEINLSVLTEAFESTPINKAMLQLANSLRPKYGTGIITDNKSDRITYLSDYFGLRSLFDPIVVSAEHGSGKDQPHIFCHALSAIGIAPNEGLFIDNSQRNLVAPAALGMATVYFDDSVNNVQRLISVLASEHGVTAGDA